MKLVLFHITVCNMPCKRLFFITSLFLTPSTSKSTQIHASDFICISFCSVHVGGGKRESRETSAMLEKTMWSQIKHRICFVYLLFPFSMCPSHCMQYTHTNLTDPDFGQISIKTAKAHDCTENKVDKLPYC